tara:strand:+ start:1124 stop:1504 length:381 start_codon:yes stop_codon:yes gene_type:complete
MKVDEIIKELQKLPSDMEVKMYIPIVEDWVDIKLDEVELHRVNKETKLEVRNKQNIHLNEDHNMGRRTDYTIDEIENDEWELYDTMSMSAIDDKMYEECYDKTNVLLISNVFKGVSTFDRMGDIEY